MLLIIHGEDEAASRNYLLTQKKENSRVMSDEFIAPADLIQFFEGNSLFLEEKHLIIENFLSQKKQSKEHEIIVGLLNKYSKLHTILLWEKNEIPKKSLALFPLANIKVFLYPKFIFAFLDGIRPKNKKLLALFHELLKTSEVELVFFMLVRHVRILLGLSDKKSTEAIDEIKRLAPWQKTKLEKQLAFFTREQLITLFQKLHDIDVKIKTGQAQNLVRSIDILLLEL